MDRGYSYFNLSTLVLFLIPESCNAKPINTPQYILGYPEFGALLNQTGRPMIYSCSW